MGFPFLIYIMSTTDQQLLLTPKPHQHLISSYSTTLESNI